jgi:hypothetical protein
MQSRLVAFTIGMLITATAAPAQQPASNTVAPKEQRSGANQTYCIEFKDDTGSHVSRRECRTRKDWKSRGVDVDDLQGS